MVIGIVHQKSSIENYLSKIVNQKLFTKICSLKIISPINYQSKVVNQELLIKIFLLERLSKVESVDSTLF